MLSREHEGIVAFVKVNIDEEPELAQAYRISSIPAVLLFDSGAPTAWSLGAKPGYVLERELGLARAAKRARKKKQTNAEGDGPGRPKSWWGARGR
jgi:thioredoxin-like negative regulator of GroEL